MPGQNQFLRAGLNDFLFSVFLHMAVSVAISAAAAALVEYDPAVRMRLMTDTGLTLVGWIVLLSPLALIVLIGTGADRLSEAVARLLLFTYAGLVGLSLGTLFIGLAATGILVAFAAAACAFGIFAFLGLRMGHSLSNLGAFLMIALAGLVAALIANLFLRSALLDLGLSAAGIVVFAALTAFDMQRLRRIYFLHVQQGEAASASVGALTLYLDLLNIFVPLLHFSGRRR